MIKYGIWVISIAIIYLQSCGPARLDQKKKHFLHKGNLSYKEKLYFDAIRYYREAIQMDSSFAQAYNNLGIVYAKTGELEKAVDVYDKSLENDPEFVDAYYNRSNAYYELGSYREAISDLNVIRNSYTPKEAIQFAKGLSFFGLKNYDSAEYVFTKALEVDTLNSELYLNLAATKYYKGLLVDAKKLIDQSLRINENAPEAYNLMGLIHVAMKEYPEAIKDYDKGLTLESNNAFILNNRGYIYLQRDQLEKALEDINESIVINPDNAWAYRNKGIYYYKIDEIENALRLLLQSVRMDNSMELSYYYLGEIYLLQGDLTNACEAFNSSARLGEKEGEKAYRQYCQ